MTSSTGEKKIINPRLNETNLNESSEKLEKSLSRGSLQAIKGFIQFTNFRLSLSMKTRRELHVHFFHQVTV